MIVCNICFEINGRKELGDANLLKVPNRYFDLVWQHTFVSPSAFSRRAVVSYWRKHVHKVLVNRLGGLSLPRKSVVRLTDRPDMTLDVYRGRKTKIQQLRFGRFREFCVVVVVLLYVHGQLFLGRLWTPKRLTSVKCTYFSQ